LLPYSNEAISYTYKVDGLQTSLGGFGRIYLHPGSQFPSLNPSRGVLRLLSKFVFSIPSGADLLLPGVLYASGKVFEGNRRLVDE
jgi:hypothetical protein